MTFAASKGHLEIVKWLHDNRSEGCKANTMNLAAENGHLNVLKWLHRIRKGSCTTHAMDWAAANGSGGEKWALGCRKMAS